MNVWIVAVALGATVGCGGRLAEPSEDDGGVSERISPSEDAGSAEDARASRDAAPSSEASECTGYSSSGYNPVGPALGVFMPPPTDCSSGQGKP
jgi:hypothetical protein